MKSVGIVTFHRANNYGVLLQAYATALFIGSKGYNAQIVDYTNAYEQRIQKLVYKEGGRTIGYVTSFLKNVLLRKRYYFKKAFGNIDILYPLSARKYTKKEELDNLEYDILVAGSDQIWNPTITDGIDDVFFLNFGKAGRRVSVASSMGSTPLSESDQEIVRSALQRFTAISVREDFAREQLMALTDLDIKVLLDPTFLLSREDWWERLGSKSKYAHTTEKYILTYFVAPNKEDYHKRVVEYAEQLHLPVWTIQYSNYNWAESSKKIVGATLEDFIALISNAELVLTDSFHGNAFSINLHRDFVAFRHKTNPVRVVSLLKKLGISERLDMKPEEYKVVDYTEVTPRLEALREDSRTWVLNALGGE